MGINKIKFLRMQKNLRQFDIAKAVGISEGYVSKIETGRMEPSKELYLKILEFLKVDICEVPNWSD